MTSLSMNEPLSPNENLAIPDWINGEYIQTVVETDIRNFDKILNCIPIAATAPGENYTSTMVRILVEVLLKDGTTLKTSYILKTALEAGTQGAEMVNQFNFFVKEKQMYQTILPNFHKLYKDAGEDIQLSPKCLHIEETPERISLVMEDLKLKNFINVDRLAGLDMPHISCALRKLAELHAASAVYYEINGSYDEVYTKSFYNEDSRKFFEELSNIRQPLYLKAMLTWKMENPQYYIDKVPEANVYFDEGIRINIIDPNEFNVLNHGDCWSNNILFNYKENGEIDQSILVDFQIGKWGPPAQDLWYLITTSVNLNIKVSEFDHFIYIYHKRLVECLKLLKYSKPIPSLKDIHIMMIKYGFWGVITSQGVMVAILLPTDKNANIDYMMKQGPEGDEFRYKSFTNPFYARAMCQLNPFLDNKGLLDFYEK